MSEILYFYPANETVYRRILRDLTPILDREGLSFHIARPEEAHPYTDTNQVGVYVTEERGCCV